MNIFSNSLRRVVYEIPCSKHTQTIFCGFVKRFYKHLRELVPLKSVSFDFKKYRMSVTLVVF